MSEQELLHVVEEARALGETIVMTNGCFDILHAGHVHYLNQAAALGDRLIVAVNVDETVRALKGDDRPVNTLESRMTVLAGLAAQRVLAAEGAAIGEGMGALTVVFLVLVAFVVVGQVIPAVVMFGSMLVGLFSPKRAKVAKEAEADQTL